MKTIDFKNNEIITLLLNLNANQLKLIDKLADLEIKGLENSFEYQETRSNALLYQEFINKKLNELTYEQDDYFRFKSSFKKRNSNCEYDDINYLQALFDDNLIDEYIRLSMQLDFIGLNRNYIDIDKIEINNKVVYDSKANYLDGDFDNFTELLDSITDNSGTSFIDAYKTRNTAKKNFIMLLYSTLLEYIEEELLKVKNKDLKKSLIKLKYNIIYLLDDITIPFLKNEDYKNTRYHRLGILLGLKNKYEAYEDVFLEELFILCEHYLYDIASYTDDMLKDKNNLYNLYLKVILEKTALSINTDGEYDSSVGDLIDDLILVSASQKAEESLKETVKLNKRLCLKRLTNSE